MREIRFYHVDAFTDVAFGGNPAGVVPEAKGLSTEEMQKIAKEINLSETAFLLPPNDSQADFRVHYFTPKDEIDFCGHATLGLAWVLATEYGWQAKAERVILETNVGLIPVAWEQENAILKTVVMTQVAPKMSDESFPVDSIAQMVGVPIEDIDDRYPIKLASTGNWHLFVPVKSQDAIDLAKPMLAELGIMNQALNISTTHLFTFSTKEAGYDLYTRDFAPAVGIPEDPVTGSANGALAGYLLFEGVLQPDQNHQLKIAQGHAIGRPGTLHVTIHPGEQSPVIQVGGSAVISIKGMVFLP